MDTLTANRNKMNRTIARNIRKLSPEEAKAVIESLVPNTIFQPAIRAITGGLNSQSINGMVIHKLAVRAGIRT